MSHYTILDGSAHSRTGPTYNVAALAWTEFSVSIFQARPCNKRVIGSTFRGAKSQQKTLQMTISISKTEKTLKNSMLLKLAPQPGLEPETYGLTEN
jgi:hypothetical protein